MKILPVLLLIGSVAYGQDVATSISPLPVDIISDSKTNVVDVTINKKRVQFTDHASTVFESWRFVTDGTVMIGDLFKSASTTYSPYKIVECKTFDIATNTISELKLKLTEQQNDHIARLAEEQVAKPIDPKEIPQ